MGNDRLEEDVLLFSEIAPPLKLAGTSAPRVLCACPNELGFVVARNDDGQVSLARLSPPFERLSELGVELESVPEKLVSSRSGRYVASVGAGDGALLEIWDLLLARRIHRGAREPGERGWVSFAPSERFAIAGAGPRAAVILLPSGEEAGALALPSEQAGFGQIDPSGEQLVLWSPGCLHLLDLATQQWRALREETGEPSRAEEINAYHAFLGVDVHRALEEVVAKRGLSPEEVRWIAQAKVGKEELDRMTAELSERMGRVIPAPADGHELTSISALDFDDAGGRLIVCSALGLYVHAFDEVLSATTTDTLPRPARSARAPGLAAEVSSDVQSAAFDRERDEVLFTSAGGGVDVLSLVDGTVTPRILRGNAEPARELALSHDRRALLVTHRHGLSSAAPAAGLRVWRTAALLERGTVSL